jgi:uncharacterized membrane protein
MEEVIISFRNVLDTCGEFVEVILNAISLMFIVAGVFDSFRRSLKRNPEDRNRTKSHVFFRMTFGAWLVVALELQLAADIVGTIISPSYQHLILLGAVALIRTFLNYFLSRELSEEIRTSRESIDVRSKA